MEEDARQEEEAPSGGHSGRAGSVTLLVGAMLFAFTALSLYTGKPGRVGYGWATLGASLVLATLGLAMRRGVALGALPAAALLAALTAVWALRLFSGLDLGLIIWAAICLFALREVGPAAISFLAASPSGK